LSWTGPTNYRGPISVFIIGQLATDSLSQPHSNLGNDAIYHLDLLLEKDTAMAIQAVFDNGPVENH
jgi:hypothetical protein